MDITTNWIHIRRHFNKSFCSNFHVAIASVDTENHPTVTPIGSLFLKDDQTGFYFEKYLSKIPRHATTNPNICALAVNSGRLFWLRSLFSGKFSTNPAIRLYGVLGERRNATSVEMARRNRRMKATKGLKGNSYLWGSMEDVRDIQFTKAEKINLGKMTN